MTTLNLSSAPMVSLTFHSAGGSYEIRVSDATEAARGLALFGNGGNDALLGSRFNDSLDGGAGVLPAPACGGFPPLAGVPQCSDAR